MGIENMGIRLTEIRDSMELSMSEFCTLLDLKKSTLNGWEGQTRQRIGFSLVSQFARREGTKCYVTYLLLGKTVALPEQLVLEGEPVAENIGGRLKALREHFGLSRPVLAAMAGFPPTTMKNWETGYRDRVPASLGYSVLARPEMELFTPYFMYLLEGEVIDIGEQLVPVVPSAETGRSS